MSMQTKLGHAMLKSLLALRQQKGTINIEDVGAILQHMASTLQPDASDADQFLQNEIIKMANDIQQARQEIFAMGADPVSGKNLGDASQHLDAVIKHTEEATDTILDAADKIQHFIHGAGGDREQGIMDATTRIYEACNFQDLTGQRITKVLQLMEHLEGRILKLSALFSPHAAPNADCTASGDPLLTGPQLPGTASSQAEIDALLESLGRNG